jgi:hypothetical protein
MRPQPGPAARSCLRTDLETGQTTWGTEHSTFDMPTLDADEAGAYYRIRTQLQIGQYQDFERWETVAGQQRYFRCIKGPYPDPHGQLGVFGVYIDITDRQLADQNNNDSPRKSPNGAIAMRCPLGGQALF